MGQITFEVGLTYVVKCGRHAVCTSITYPHSRYPVLCDVYENGEKVHDDIKYTMDGYFYETKDPHAYDILSAIDFTDRVRACLAKWRATDDIVAARIRLEQMRIDLRHFKQMIGRSQRKT